MNHNRKKLAALVSSFFSLGVGAPLTNLPLQIQVNGALIEPAALISLLNQLNAANIGADGLNFQTSAAASITLTSLQNLCQRLTNGGAVTVTLDSAWAIVNAIANPFSGQTFPFQIVGNASTTVATPTLTGSGVTLAGTTTVTSGGSRFLQGQITQISTTTGSAVTSGTTFSSISQIGSTNRYTVTLSGNSISPVVGNAIFLNVTAGTLPAGWYPIDLVSSATSFVVVLPPSGTAWTATAATIPGTTTIPTSQYQSGFTGIFSPLLTVTGMYGMAAGVIVV